MEYRHTLTTEVQAPGLTTLRSTVRRGDTIQKSISGKYRRTPAILVAPKLWWGVVDENAGGLGEGGQVCMGHDGHRMTRLSGPCGGVPIMD